MGESKIKMNKFKDNTVSIARVLGMFFIMLCHLATWYGIEAFAQLFNVGVQLFLFISGYMYGKKHINDYGKWLKTKFLRICIPLYIFISFMFIYQYIVLHIDINLKSILTYLFNLEGIGMIIIFSPLSLFQFEPLQGTGQLWFLTAIMFCYFGVIIIQKLELKYKDLFNKKNLINIAIIFILIQCAISYLHIQINHIFIFFVGYFLSRYLTKISLIQYINFTIIMAGAMALRLITRSLIDGTILYDYIVTSLTHDILAIWIYISIYTFNQYRENIITFISNSSLWKSLDRLSYYVYITHYMYLVGPFKLEPDIINNYIGGGVYSKIIANLSCTILFFILSFISAITLYYICNLVYKLLKVKL